jgi:hypothetical protein
MDFKKSMEIYTSKIPEKVQKEDTLVEENKEESKLGSKEIIDFSVMNKKEPIITPFD